MTITIITWHDVSTVRPDADETVLIFNPDMDPTVWLGYLDGEQWRSIEGQPMPAPTRWATMPDEPAQSGVSAPATEVTTEVATEAAPAANAQPGELPPLPDDNQIFDHLDRPGFDPAQLMEAEQRNAFESIRELMTAYARAALAQAQSDSAGDARDAEWIERWHGSGGTEGLEGWSILRAGSRELVAYLGREIHSRSVTELVAAHNAAIAASAAKGGAA